MNGPRARNLLQALSSEAGSNAGFLDLAGYQKHGSLCDSVMSFAHMFVGVCRASRSSFRPVR